MEDTEERLDAGLARIQAEFCKTMGNPIRVMLMYCLRAGEKCVSDLSESLGCSQPTISRHLSVLRGIDMVTSRRDGQHVFYRLTDPKITTACDTIREILQRRTAARGELFEE